MKLKLKSKIGMMLSVVVVGTTVLALNSFDSKGSENNIILESSQNKFVVEHKDDTIFLKTILTEDSGLSDNLSGNPYGFAKILDSNYESVATKVRIDYNDDFFNKLEENIYDEEGMMLGQISEEDWIEFYKDANAQGVENYLNKSGEHSLIVRLSGTNFRNNTVKFVNIDNTKKYSCIEDELQSLSKNSISQYLIEECGKLVFVKDNKGYRKASDKESEIILGLDEKLRLETGSKIALKYYKEDTVNDEKSPKYRLETVEIYNKNLDDMYINIDFSEETLNLIEKIKKGCTTLDIKYRETNDLYNYTI